MNYGDYDNIRKDSINLIDVLNRQGSDIFFEILADHVATSKNKFNLSQDEVNRVINSHINTYRELIEERT